jgi:hypothetical protein
MSRLKYTPYSVGAHAALETTLSHCLENVESVDILQCQGLGGCSLTQLPVH